MTTVKLTRFEVDELLREGRAIVGLLLAKSPPPSERITQWARSVRAGLLQEPDVADDLRRKIEEHTRLLIAPELGTPRDPVQHAERLNRTIDFTRHNLEFAPTKIAHPLFAKLVALVLEEGRRSVPLSQLDDRGLDTKDVRRGAARMVDLKLAAAVADDADRIEPDFSAIERWTRS
ncbi:MAG: hypothetical protein HY791_26640 [Deltaproteobacteria bacterium]|nr:hypothetical protein [Deltaproteobacteria bacterium]